MSIGGIPPIGSVPIPVNVPNSDVASIGSVAGGGIEGSGEIGEGFGDLVQKSLEETSETEFKADDLIRRLAAGEDVRPHEVMIANSQAALSVEMMVAARNKALEAYREIMNLQM